MSRMTTSVRFVSLFSTALCLSLLSGCSGGKGKPSQANFDAIKTGMTEAEVDTLMGPPAAGADPKAAMNEVGKLGGGVPNVGDAIKEAGGMMPKVKVWKDGSKTFTVTFDKDGKVTVKS